MSFAEVLRVARKSKGWTQEDLAAVADVSQAAITRYENSERQPEPDVVTKLATALGVTHQFLVAASQYRGAMAVDVHMRRRLTAKPTVWKQLEARLNIYRMHTHLLLERVSIDPESSIPTFDPVDTTPDSAARMVRMQWRLPVGSVHSLTQWLEAAGCVVIEEDFGTSRVDGLSQWIGAHPMMLINLRIPTDRKRLTMAHELGHLCLHSNDVTDDMEREANKFAAELLMPREAIRTQLRNLTVGKLHDLKRAWKVSMQALIERAFELEAISANQRTNLYKLLSHYGWRTQEPLSDELPAEHAALPGRIGDHLTKKGLSVREIAELAGFCDSTAHPFSPSSPTRTLRLVH